VAIQDIQSLLNELYQICLGTLPRTLADLGLDRQTLAGLAQDLFSHPEIFETNCQGIDPEKAQAILIHALDGRPQNNDCLTPA
jgi:hypothetical protein